CMPPNRTHFIFFFQIRLPPTPTLFPYTTLFRSHPSTGAHARPWHRYRLPVVRAVEGIPDGRRRRGRCFGGRGGHRGRQRPRFRRSKSTRLNSSHVSISYAVFCLKKKTHHHKSTQ